MNSLSHHCKFKFFSTEKSPEIVWSWSQGFSILFFTCLNLYRAFYPTISVTYEKAKKMKVIALYIGLSTINLLCFLKSCMNCYRPLYRAFYNKILCLLYLSFLYLDTYLFSCQYFPQKVGRSLFTRLPKSLYLSHFFDLSILPTRPTDFFMSYQLQLLGITLLSWFCSSSRTSLCQVFFVLHLDNQ